MLTIQELGLGMTAAMEQLRRAVFNVVARNQDDHVKNIAFLMDRTGTWSLSPAFDVIYAWQPDGQWTSRHQMSINGKRDGFDRADLVALAQTAGIKAHRAAEIMDDVLSAVRNWRDHASAAGVGEKVADQIARAHRTGL
jgi:serine/threonine-protein kinase HipA